MIATHVGRILMFRGIIELNHHETLQPLMNTLLNSLVKGSAKSVLIN